MKSFRSKDVMVLESVPVLIDEVAKYSEPCLVRCGYFSLEYTRPSPNWRLALQEVKLPFLMLGLSGIMYLSASYSLLFDTPEAVEKTFDLLDSLDDVNLDIGDVWLPMSCFSGEAMGRGQVYRIEFPLFVEAYKFRNEQISRAAYLFSAASMVHQVRYSPDETESISAWMHKVMAESIRSPKYGQLESLDFDNLYRGKRL